MMTIRSMINRAGMPILQNFSMPSATPAATMNTLIAMKIAVQRIIWPPLRMNWPKNSEISATFQVFQPKIAVR